MAFVELIRLCLDRASFQDIVLYELLIMDSSLKRKQQPQRELTIDFVCAIKAEYFSIQL